MALSRRRFVRSTLGAAAALGALRSSRAVADGSADVRVAQIGFNGQGSGHIQNLGSRIVALCDVDEHVLGRKAEDLKSKLGRSVETFTDYRKLLDSGNFDAVSIATPNHTHALIAVAAIQAGKHVYVEKPVSYNIWEGRQIVAAARRHNRIVQTGTQSRSSQAIQEAVAYVRRGELGAIRYAMGCCYKGRPSIGQSSTPFKFPEFVHRDLWIGPAADQPFYRPEHNSQGGGRYNPHYDWHWDYNTGCGDLGNQGIHQMDVARWFLGESTLAPYVFSAGGRLGYDDAGDTPNTQVVFHAYEKAPLLFEVRGLPRTKTDQASVPWGDRMDNYRGVGIGNLIQCEKGYVVVSSAYSDAQVYDDRGQLVKEFRGGGGHHDNWLEAIVAGDRSQLHAEIQEGHLSSALCHAGNVSYRVGKPASAAEIADKVRGSDLLAASVDRMLGHLRGNGVDVDATGALTLGEWLRIDPQTETFVGNDAASALRARAVQRKPFEVPDVERETAAQSAAGGG